MIPLTKDVAGLVGEWAQEVENRSLLHQKFSLPKVWNAGPDGKLPDAGRWSVLRIVTRGADLLGEDSRRLRREASGRNVAPEVAQRKVNAATVAEKMAQIARQDPALTTAVTNGSLIFLQQATKSFGQNVAAFEATLGSRMMINMAGGVIENAGIALDRCSGLPIIPGSAIKGVARAQALWEIRDASGTEKRMLLKFAMLLFGFGSHDIRGDFGWAAGSDVAASLASEIGSSDFKGCASFLPARPTSPPRLVVEMVNPHYREYYSGRRLKATDDESPIPNYFPAVEAGVTFGFAVLLNRTFPAVDASEILTQARSWIEGALRRSGLGAKTAAGYGWFELGRPKSSPTLKQAAAPAACLLSPAESLIAKYKSLKTKDNFPAALPEMRKLDPPELRKAFETLVPAAERAKLRKSNPYWQAFISGKAGDAGREILTKLGLKLT